MRLGDLDALVKFIQDGLNNPDREKALGHDAIEILAEIECNMPTIHPDSLRPKGRWVYAGYTAFCGTPYCRCSLCGEGDTTHRTNFCPNCGADMR